MAEDGATPAVQGGKARERSPNYPAVPLTDSIRLVRQLYDKERRTAVPADVAAKALGYGSLSGASRTVLASLRQFGLIESDGSNARVSDLAMDIIHNPEGSPERAEALRTAAMRPPLVAELALSHPDASDHALKAYLVTRRKFSPDGAGRFIATFRDALQLAKPDAQGYTEPEMPPAVEPLPAVTAHQAPAVNEPRVSVLFSGVLAKGVTAEVRVTGDGLRPEHVERLRKHLDLAKDALEDADDDDLNDVRF